MDSNFGICLHILRKQENPSALLLSKQSESLLRIERWLVHKVFAEYSLLLPFHRLPFLFIYTYKGYSQGLARISIFQYSHLQHSPLFSKQWRECLVWKKMRLILKIASRKSPMKHYSAKKNSTLHDLFEYVRKLGVMQHFCFCFLAVDAKSWHIKLKGGH